VSLRVLHEEFQADTLAEIHKAFVDVIVEKIRQQGLEPSAEDVQAIGRYLRSPDEIDTLQLSSSMETPGHITITLTPTDVADAEARGQKVLDAVERVAPALVQSTAGELLESFQKRWPAEARQQRRVLAGFRRRLRTRWGAPLDTLACLLTICRELGEEFLTHEATEEKPFLTDVLARLHARGCQVAEEVLELLRGGYADGAIARWRTLYELTISAEFIQAHGEPAAERFVDYHAVEAWHAADQYRKHHAALGLSPEDPAESSAVDARYKAALAKHGEDFRRPCAWAAPFLPAHQRRNPTFTDIEAAVGSGHWRPYHRLASDRVHANPTGTFYKLGLGDQTILLTGPSNVGLADPGQLTALMLTRLVTAFVLSQEPTFDIAALLNVCLRLSNIAQSQFLEVEIAMKEGPDK
jgi:hypothetical protein